MARYEKFGKELSNLGYDITPLNGKVPILAGWHKRPAAAKDFKRYTKSNIGIVLGGASNIVAVDIDVRHEGAAGVIKDLALSELGAAPERVGAAPKTLLVYRCSEPFTKVKTGIYDIEGMDANVEILGDGQQFVASGKHPDTKKNYRWPKDSIMDVGPGGLTKVTPRDLTGFLTMASNALAEHGDIKARSLSGNSKNNMHFDFANSEQQSTASKIRAAMAYLPNDDLHYDDWVYTAHAIKGALGDGGRELFTIWSRRSKKYDSRETDRLWHSIGEVKTIGAGTVFHMAARHGYDPAEQARSEILEKAARQERPEQEEQPQQVGPEDTIDKKEQVKHDTGEPPPRFAVTWWKNIEATTDTTDFVEDTLGGQQMSVVYGESNTGKTFWVLDLAFHIATGRNWNGLEVDKGAVIYCALEGAHGITNRIAALKFHYQGDLDNGDANPPLGVITTSINLLDPKADLGDLITAIQLEQSRMGVPLRMLVIDTLARALSGGNENSPDDMGALVKNTDVIRAATGVHVCLIHHSGKDQARGARGHSSLRAATDTEIEISRPPGGDISMARVTKQREFEGDQEYAFGLTVVELGITRRNKQKTSCVVYEADVKDAKRAKKRLPSGKNMKIALKILLKLLDTDIAYISTAEGAPGCKGVNIEPWKQAAFEEAQWGYERQANRFDTAKTALIADGFVGHKGDFFWII